MVLTDAQHRLVGALDDGAEHVAWEFDPDEWRGVSTCGFAHIHIPDGRCSFVQTLRGLADDPEFDWITSAEHRSGHSVEIGCLELTCNPASTKGGYRLSITNTRELCHGPSFQRMDVQQHLHELLLNRLQLEHDYLPDASVRTRID